MFFGSIETFGKLRSHGVITKNRIRLTNQIRELKTNYKDSIKPIVDDLQGNRIKEAFQRIKRMTILNPQKRDGGLYTSFLNEE